jgi:uracil-DNA glycosylase
MNAGFFPSSTKTARVSIPLLAQCGVCGLHKKCISPKMPVRGKGKRNILVVGEAPGQSEDEQNKPFVGKSGQLLQETLRKFGVDLWQDCWVTNSVICRPPSNKFDDKTIVYCRPNLVKAVKELKPHVIIVLGSKAVHSLLGWLWKSDIGSISKWVGWKIPCQEINSYICPTYHPSHILRTEGMQKNRLCVERLFFEKHLESACKLTKRPWKVIPDYKSQVRVILDTQEASKCIQRFTEERKLIAFDYEADGLKPESEEIDIVSCAISNGETTISYPWHGQAIRATKELLLSKCPKIAANAKYEHKFSLTKLGIRVKSWAFDTMIAAHVLDSRSEITSLKFQAFVQLGQADYDSHIKPYFKSASSNTKNRTREIPLEQLLIYNGLDSLLEYKLAKIQARKLRMEL